MVKKSPCPPSGYFGYEYELTIQFNTVYNSFCACLRLANRRILCFIKIFLENSPLCVGSFENAVLRVTKGEIKQSPAFAVAKGGEAMKMVVQHYEGYISYLSTRTLKDERGNTYYGIDEDIRDRLRSKLMRAVLDFEV